MEKHKKSILLVDDLPQNIEIIIMHIENSGLPYTIYHALNGEMALNIAKLKIPDLVITDWEMPEMNGIELIKQLKKNVQTKDIPVIMCTGVMTTSENLSLALNTGAIDYIRKPIDKIELIARIQATLRLADSYNEIKELNRIKEIVFSIIAHDLRSPLATMQTYFHLLNTRFDSIDKNKIGEFLKKLERQNASLFDVLDNLLYWGRNRHNQVNFNPVERNLFNEIQAALDLVSDNANRKNINLVNETPDNIVAYFDPVLLSSVLRNLVANAIKFTNEGGWIRIRSEKAPPFVRITVEDNGVGISTDEQKKLFDPYVFNSTAGTANEKGTGLGLKLCYDLVKIHGGKIDVDSQENKGSRFIISLPDKSTE